ncbi:MAG: leucyl aminopeptidase [Verrucomicrobia bacterium]|nr:leucyl aminopeptidase [Verrucomicrobiota bacterium]
MNFRLVCTTVFSQRVPALILFCHEKERPAVPIPFRNLLDRLPRKEFNGADKQLLLLHSGASHLLLAGLGKRGGVTPEKIRRATGAAVKRLGSIGITQAAVQLGMDQLVPTVEAAILASYQFLKFKAPSDNHTALKSLTLCLPKDADLAVAKALLARARVIAESANYARAIGNLPANLVYPEVLADHARSLAEECHLACTVLDKPALESAGFGGLLAVGSGSARDPRLIALAYNPEPRTENREPIALVGKALTFDSGGISIKPADKMDEMKFDKCGGLAVLGAMRAIATLRLPLHVIGVIAAAENMPSATSYRPGDIVTSYKGNNKRAVTIEVLNTDAEGRVVLGDALTYARERNPQAIIDLATLTGACVVALGPFAAGVLGNDEQLQQQLRAAGERTGERLWPLPLWQEYKDKIKSDVADIKNTGGRDGGASTAAAFLAKFVGDTPWAHLDIAGTAWTTEEHPYLGKGATGFGVRLLLDALQHWK